MKNTRMILCFALFVDIILLPLGGLLTACFGYTFSLANDTVFATITALLAGTVVVMLAKGNKDTENKRVQVLLALMAPLSLINAVFYLFEVRTMYVAICMFLSICCCICLAIRYGKPKVLKIVALCISAVMILPVVLLGFFTLTFGNIGQNTVVQTVSSPNGTYYAEVIDSDQGALGGDTFVDIYESANINLVLFNITKKPQRIYHGNWGAYKTMQIYWKENDCLVINGTEYVVN